MLDVVIGDDPAAVAAVPLGVEGFVGGVRSYGDDVPGVYKAGKEAEAAQSDVNDAVGRTDAALDPHGQRREKDGNEAEEDVAPTHAKLNRL